MYKGLIIAAGFLLFSCNQEVSKTLKVGIWRGELQVSDQDMLPFNFEVTSPHSLKLYNADEVIFWDDITYRNDSVLIKMPAFDRHYILAQLTDSILNGVFVKENEERTVPFRAQFGIKERFDIIEQPKHNVSGKWETIFSQGIDDKEYEALGDFQQDGNKVTGTFLTPTGDYRFLEGILNGNHLKLSAFDGSHVFYFTATVSDSIMEGIRFNGNHFTEPFFAKRNDHFEMDDPETLTFLKEGYDKIEFSFPDTSGHMVSLSDPRFFNKVVIVQLMGSWCTNCLDETKYFSNYYREHKDRNIEFVALAFEYAKTEEGAFNSMKRLKNKIGIDYPILLAQYGTVNKTEAQKKLPMLNSIVSYPTTIFIDKKGKVRKIHAGFNGPATGEKYTAFKEEFEKFIDDLLEE